MGLAAAATVALSVLIAVTLLPAGLGLQALASPEPTDCWHIARARRSLDASRWQRVGLA